MSWSRDVRDATILLVGASVVGAVRIVAAGGAESFAGVEAPPECVAAEVDFAGLPRIAVADALPLSSAPGVTFVDARAVEDHRSGHIPGALGLPAADAAGLLEVQSVPISPTDRVIVYCDGALACSSSEALGLLLRDRVACESIEVLEGGLSAWVAAGGPLEGGA